MSVATGRPNREHFEDPSLLCWAVLVSLIQTGVTDREGTSVDVLLPYDKSDTLKSDVRGSSPLWAVTPRQVFLGCIQTLAGQVSMQSSSTVSASVLALASLDGGL